MSAIWRIRAREVDLEDGKIMGVVNVTPDSFSDGGRYLDVKVAVEHALSLVDEGVEILDVGGESTRPGASPVDVAEELRRVIPVLQQIRAALPDVLLSVDTSKPEVAREALAAGADIINDINGLGDPDMMEVGAETGAGLIVMHKQGTPDTMQLKPSYGDVVAEVREFFYERLKMAVAAGVSEEAILFDPGIGFGKRLEDNLLLLQQLANLRVADRPLLVGASRKSFLGRLIESDSVRDREWPTVALTALAREKGVRVIRVHEVRASVQALKMVEAILGTP